MKGASNGDAYKMRVPLHDIIGLFREYSDGLRLAVFFFF